MLWAPPVDRQMNDKGRACIGFAACLDAAAMIRDDVTAYRQPQAGAGAHIAGGEKRVEDARQYFSRDAASGIGEADDDLVVLDAALDANFAAFFHRLRRVEQQVEEYLAQVTHLAAQWWQLAQHQFQFGAAVDLRGSHIAGGTDAMVEIDDLFLGLIHIGKSLEVRHDARHTVGSLHTLL